MHTFGAMTFKCKLAQHTRRQGTTVSAGTPITVVCLSGHTEDTRKADACADRLRFELPMALRRLCVSTFVY